MIKLSDAQQKVIDIAKKEIDAARAYKTFNEYCNGEMLEYIRYDNAEQFKEMDPDGYRTYEKDWERRKKGVVLISASSKTLWRLRDLGFIEIIKDSNGKRYGTDIIKVLNY